MRHEKVLKEGISFPIRFHGKGHCSTPDATLGELNTHSCARCTGREPGTGQGMQGRDGLGWHQGLGRATGLVVLHDRVGLVWKPWAGLQQHISPVWHCAPLERLWTKWHQIRVVPWLCAMKNSPVQYLSINKEP